MDHNPNLKPWQSLRAPTDAGQGQIEAPDSVTNLVWQTRSSPPDDYSIQLAGALENLFLTGASSLEEIVAGLNAGGLKTAAGSAWDEASFQAEMKRLGA